MTPRRVIPPSPIVDAVPDALESAWDRVDLSAFVPDTLEPLEMTAEMFTAYRARKGQIISVTRARVLLANGTRDGRYTRRWARVRHGRGEYVYKPAVKENRSKL